MARLGPRALIGTAVLVIAMLAGAAHAKTRSGVRWSARPIIVRQGDTAALGWTIVARGIDTRRRKVPCVQFEIEEQYGELQKRRFQSNGGSDRRGAPSNGCAPTEPTIVTASRPWRFEVAADGERLAPGEAVRARIKLVLDVGSVELGSAMLAVDDDGTPRLSAR